VIEQIARNCRLLPQNLANCIGDFRPIRESAQWLRNSSRTTLKREPLPDKIILPAEVIDKTNYKAWLVPVDQRSCPEWSEVPR
jgi:hypothetical protein